MKSKKCSILLILILSIFYSATVLAQDREGAESKDPEDKMREDYRFNAGYSIVGPALDYFNISFGYTLIHKKNYFSVGVGGNFRYASLMYKYGYDVYQINKHFSIIPEVGFSHQLLTEINDEYSLWFLSKMISIDYLDTRVGLNFRIGYSFSFNLDQVNHLPILNLGWSFK